MRLPIIIVSVLLFSCTIFQDENQVVQSKYNMEMFNNEISKYGLNDGDTLLDIGSGFGYHDATIFRFYPNMFFICEDIDSVYSKLNNSQITIAGKGKYFKDNAKYVNGSIDSVPLPGNSYKNILCRKTVHEFEDPARMIAELRRLLTLDGLLIVVEANPKDENDFDPYCKKRYLAKEELIEMFTENGFKFISGEIASITRKKKGNLMNILKFRKNPAARGS